MTDLDIIAQLDDKAHLLEPIIQKMVQAELQKLANISPFHSKNISQSQWQTLIQETSGSWQEMPTAEEIREGWEQTAKRE